MATFKPVHDYEEALLLHAAGLLFWYEKENNNGPENTRDYGWCWRPVEEGFSGISSFYHEYRRFFGIFVE